MMTPIVPLHKRSKKQQREYHAKQRGCWYGLNPVTRIKPNGKGYDRAKEKQRKCKSFEYL